MKRLLTGLVAGLVLLAAASAAAAQGLSVSLRGGGAFPMGALAEEDATASDELALAAQNGFGYGLDVGYGFGLFGVYAGFDQLRFGCDEGTQACGNDGDYTPTGFTAGIELTPFQTGSVIPWIKGGVTFDALKVASGDAGNRLSAERAPGFEVGTGVDIPLGGLLELQPQVRYGGQSPELDIPGVDAPPAEEDIRYFTASLGLGLAFPLGGMR